MTYWEFLIQRENDRAWRPLTSRNLQVFEGNYRIIANTNITNSAVRTQVFYQTDRQPPQLSQKRSQTISNEGMLVVLPFTYLRAGTWHLNCNVTVSVDREDREQLRLKVIPRTVATNPEPVTPEPGVAPPPATDINIATSELHTDELIATSVSDLNVLLADLDLPPQPMPLPVAGDLAVEEAAVSDRPLQLDCEIFHAAEIAAVMITGLVNLDMLSTPAGKLVVTVRNPQDGTMLTKVEQVLPLRKQQFAFQVPLELPNASNHFLMGEISLQNANNEPLVANSFTITFDAAPVPASPTSDATIPPIPLPADLTDPFAAALQIAMMQRERQNPVSPAVTAAQLQQIIAASDLEIARLDTSDVPLHSYDPNSYEVVVED